MLCIFIVLEALAILRLLVKKRSVFESEWHVVYTIMAYAFQTGRGPRNARSPVGSTNQATLDVFKLYVMDGRKRPRSRSSPVEYPRTAFRNPQKRIVFVLVAIITWLWSEYTSTVRMQCGRDSSNYTLIRLTVIITTTTMRSRRFLFSSMHFKMSELALNPTVSY